MTILLEERRSVAKLYCNSLCNTLSIKVVLISNELVSFLNHTHTHTHLLCDFLYTLAQLVHHVAHLQSFVGAEVVEVVLVSHALVEMPQRIPPCHQELQDHLHQLISLQQQQDGWTHRTC